MFSAAPSFRGLPRGLSVPVRYASEFAPGLRPRRVRADLAYAVCAMWPRACLDGGGTLKSLLSRLNTGLSRSPVNASTSPLRAPPHDSGSGWFAIPSLCRTFTGRISSVSRRTKAARSARGGVLRARRTSNARTQRRRGGSGPPQRPGLTGQWRPRGTRGRSRAAAAPRRSRSRAMQPPRTRAAARERRGHQPVPAEVARPVHEAEEHQPRQSPGRGLHDERRADRRPPDEEIRVHQRRERSGRDGAIREVRRPRR